MTMRASLLALLAAGASAMTCPGSSAWITHASCELTLTFAESCAAVRAEIADRAAGKGGWTDPHNGGRYTITAQSESELDGQRVTGDGKYTDKFVYAFAATTGSAGCTVTACSESQVTSYLDFSTNYCNLKDLYCNSADGCAVATHDLTYEESVGDCSASDFSQCLVSN